MRIINQQYALTVDGCDLANSEFRDVNLSASVFDDVNLTGVRISNANLKGANLVDCDLRGATIEGVLVSDLFAAYRGQSGKGGSDAR
jgi:uncharacterized protein YjbI with pentapeptide repeats